MESGTLGPQGHGPADQFDGPAEVSVFEVQEAEQVQGVRIVRFRGQQGMIAARGIGKAARLMHSPSDAEAAPSDSINLTSRAAGMAVLQFSGGRP